MSQLRKNLEVARDAYEQTRYPGDLASIVLGSSRTAPQAKRWNFAPLAIAAALAIGLGAGIFADRLLQPSTATVATTTTDNSQPVTVAPTPNSTVTPTNPKTAEQTDYRAVAMGQGLAEQNVSIVPDLQSLSATEATTADTKTDTKKSPTVVATSFAPMSLMLLSADEYSQQQTTTATAAKSQTRSNASSTSTLPQDRS